MPSSSLSCMHLILTLDSIKLSWRFNTEITKLSSRFYGRVSTVKWDVRSLLFRSVLKSCLCELVKTWNWSVSLPITDLRGIKQICSRTLSGQTLYSSASHRLHHYPKQMTLQRMVFHRPMQTKPMTPPIVLKTIKIRVGMARGDRVIRKRLPDKTATARAKMDLPVPAPRMIPRRCRKNRPTVALQIPARAMVRLKASVLAQIKHQAPMAMTQRMPQPRSRKTMVVIRERIKIPLSFRQATPMTLQPNHPIWEEKTRRPQLVALRILTRRPLPKKQNKMEPQVLTATTKNRAR